MSTRWSSPEHFLAECGRLLGQSLDYAATIARVAQLAVPAFADWCLVDLLSEDERTFERVAVGHARDSGGPLAALLRRSYELRAQQTTSVANAIIERRPLLARDIDEAAMRLGARDDDHLQALLGLQMKSCAIAPLVVRGKAIGALSFIACSRNYDEKDLWLVTQLAHIAGPAIENARLFEAERRARVQLGKLLEVTAALSRASTAEEVAEVVCRIGAEAIGATSAALWLAQCDGSLLLAGAWGTPAELLNQFRSIPSTAVGVPAMAVLHSGEALWVETEEDYRRASPDIFALARAAQRLSAFGALPIFLNTRVSGVLVFAHALNHRYDATEQSFFGTLAQHCSQTLDRARLLDTERKRLSFERRSNARVRLLAQVSEILSLPLNLNEKLQTIAKLLVPALADWCVIDIVDGRVIQRVATEHQDPTQVERALQHGARFQPRLGDGSAISNVIALGKSHFHPRVSLESLAHAAHDSAELEHLQKEGIVSSIVVPLIASTVCMGVFSLTTSDSGRVYEEEDLMFAEEVARRAGLSISNARLHQALESERSKLRTVFEQAPFPLGVFEGPEHRIVLANSKWEALVGRSLPVGQPLGQAVPELAEQNVIAMHDRAFAGETVVGEDMPLELMVRGQPRSHYFHVVMQPLRDGFGAIDGHVTMAMDVTDKVLAHGELETARRAAEAANRAKDEFLAMLGHELRNPLAPIVSALDLMELQSPQFSKRERSLIARQVHHLTRLVDDLLDVSRIAKGKIELNKTVSELSEIVDRALEITSPLFEQRQQQVQVTVPRLGLLIDADLARMTQAFANLLSNASKYSDLDGQISIAAALTESEILIDVRDEGIGIREDMLARIFDLFVQEQQASDRALGGLGLGLAIVKSVVTLHGGTVTATSAGLGRGSQFSVRLPQSSRPLPSNAAPPTLEQQAAPSTARRILVVDDNQDAAELLALALEAAGHDVRTASDGPSALLVLESFEADTALVDIGLPAMDGHDFARLIRKKGFKLRLIAVTGYGQPADIERSRQSGFDAHLVKPVELQLVLRAIERDPT